MSPANTKWCPLAPHGRCGGFRSCRVYEHCANRRRMEELEMSVSEGEYHPTEELRWVEPRLGHYRMLQQLWRCHARAAPPEWRDVPTVGADEAAVTTIRPATIEWLDVGCRPSKVDAYLVATQAGAVRIAYWDEGGYWKDYDAHGAPYRMDGRERVTDWALRPAHPREGGR